MHLQKKEIKVLVAPLDWGLGHATRCIPIIEELLKYEVEVSLAAEGGQEKILSEQFPQLPVLPLAGYRIKYTKRSFWFQAAIFLQIPKILAAIKKEKQWLAEKMREHAFDIVISDNRYGLHHPAAKCIFITHQLAIQVPAHKKLFHFIQKKNFKRINQFAECWVPDVQAGVSLGGALSHPAQLPSIPVKYIGLLSRFSLAQEKTDEQGILILLSGPEPQRGILEEILLDQLQGVKDNIVFVRGLPGETVQMANLPSVTFYNHLPAKRLQQEMMKAKLVISRSGYSTCMDIIALQKKAILIATPGQTEQEYLATYYMEQNLALSVAQHNLQLAQNISEALEFPYLLPNPEMYRMLEKAVAELLANG